MTDDDLAYWSPWLEKGWSIPLEQLGPPPRNARPYHPPISAGAKRLPFLAAGVVGAPLLWLVLRLSNDENPAVPVAMLAMAVGAVALAVRGPSWIIDRDPARTALDPALQLRLAERGVAVTAKVVRVVYGRTTHRSGYRDGTAIDERSGVAHLSFDTPDGPLAVSLQFQRDEPSLRDGDEVTVLYLPDEPTVWLPVFQMNDIELPTGTWR